VIKLAVTQDAFALAEVFTISRGSRTQADVLTVHLERDGYQGRGECLPYARYGESLQSVEAQLYAVQADLGHDPSIADVQLLLPAGAARNALDCALWDLHAKERATPVWQLAGLEEPGELTTAYTLSLAEPAAMQKKAALHAHRPLLKLKLGGKGDIERLRAVRQGAPNTDIIVDANEGWDVADYESLAPELIALGVKMVEQPFPTTHDDALATMHRSLPVCADESCHDTASLEKLVGKYDVVNIKLDKTGGFTESLLVREQAQAMGFELMVGCMMASSLAIAPAVLLAQGVSTIDLDAPLLLAEDRPHALTFSGSVLQPPSRSLWG